MKRSYSFTVLTACFSAHAINDGWFLVIPPLLPLIIREFYLSYFQAGILTASIIFMNSILQPFSGFFTDKLGRRKLPLVLGLGWFTVSLGLMGLAPNYAMLVVLGLLAGIGSSFYHPLATTILAAQFHERRGWALGIHGSGGSVGMFITPIVFGIMGTVWGWRQAFHMVLIPGLIVTILVWMLVKEPKIKTETVSLLKTLRMMTKPLIVMTLIFSISNMSFQGVITFLPTYFVNERGASVALAGILSSIMLFMGILSQTTSGHISDKIGRRTVIGVAMLLEMVFLLLFINTQGFPSMVFLALAGFFIFAPWPVIWALTTDLTPHWAVATAVGVLFGVASAVSAISPVVVGYIIDTLGFTWSFAALAGISGVGSLTSFWLPSGIRKKT